jgi:hypothetical protein
MMSSWHLRSRLAALRRGATWPARTNICQQCTCICIKTCSCSHRLFMHSVPSGSSSAECAAPRCIATYFKPKHSRPRTEGAPLQGSMFNAALGLQYRSGGICSEDLRKACGSISHISLATMNSSFRVHAGPAAAMASILRLHQKAGTSGSPAAVRAHSSGVCSCQQCCQYTIQYNTRNSSDRTTIRRHNFIHRTQSWVECGRDTASCRELDPIYQTLLWIDAYKKFK